MFFLSQLQENNDYVNAIEKISFRLITNESAVNTLQDFEKGYIVGTSTQEDKKDRYVK